MSEQSRSHTRALFVMLTIAATSVACSKAAPECGNPGVATLVSSITSDALFGSLSAPLKAQASQEVTFAVRDALKGNLEQDGARRTCTATLDATFSLRTKEGVDNVLAGNPAIVFQALKGSIGVAALGVGIAAFGGNQNGTDKIQILQEIVSLYQSMDAGDLAQLQKSWNPSTRALSVPIEYSVNLLEDASRFQVQTSGSEDLGRLKFVVLLAADAVLSNIEKARLDEEREAQKRSAAAQQKRQRAAEEEQQSAKNSEEVERALVVQAELNALERAKASGAELRTMFGMVTCDASTSLCRIGSSGAWFSSVDGIGKRILMTCPEGTSCSVDGWVLPTKKVAFVDKVGAL